MFQNSLTFNAAVIRRRVRAKITRFEFFAIAFCAGMLLAFTWVQSTGAFPPYDYNNYINSAVGNFSFYYYGYWFVPVFSLIHALPGPIGYILWGLLNIAGVWLAARVFGGSAGWALISYQMIYTVFYGQISGVIVGGLALLWWGMAAGRWPVAGLGMIIALTKYTFGLPLALALWLLAEVSWWDRLKVLIIPVAVGLVSLVVYPLWPVQLLHTLASNPPNSDGSIALWRWIGPLALLLWLPVLTLPMPTTPRVILLTATLALALPYFQQTDLVALYILPIGWLALLGNLGYFYPLFGWSALQFLALIPLVVYVLTLAPHIAQLRARWLNRPEGG